MLEDEVREFQTCTMEEMNLVKVCKGMLLVSVTSEGRLASL
jgi:hypothetical protein